VKHIIVLTITFFSLSFAQAAKELHAIFEVAGQDSGAMSGAYVKGVGDLNKGGYADVAVSAPGKLLTYIYYGGKTMSKTPSLTLQGGGTIVAGDFNGDGWIDLAIEKYFRDTVFIYYGGPIIDTIKSLILQSDYYSPYGVEGFGFNALAAGDINGDGYDDLVVGESQYPYVLLDSTVNGNGKILVYAGSTTGLDTNAVWSAFGDTKFARLGYNIAVGDINNDGKKDIIALGYNSISVFLGNTAFQLQRNYYIDSRNVPGSFKEHVACFDADGDGIDDILANKICIFKEGTHLDTLPTYYIPPPNNDTTNFGNFPWVSGGGDFNRDGVKDILLSATQGYYGGVPGVSVMLGRRNHPGQYAAYRIFSDYLIAPLYGRPENAGDVNGDGIDDIIIGSPNEPLFKDEGFFGIYSGDTSLVTEMKIVPSIQPESFELQQNYPNPFNPETTIRFELSQSGFVTLKIFDVLGREVAILMNETKQPGIYAVRWNAKGMPSGVYFYKLTTGHLVLQRTMVLIK
jgi:hypothetical protein